MNNNEDTRIPPKETAKALIERYKPLVYPYCGSGFMTNTIDPDVVLLNAKECANIAIDFHLCNSPAPVGVYYWLEVEVEIQNYTE